MLNECLIVCVCVCARFPCRFGDHYEWNKVTSCIHNILSGQRWIEHYGEMAIRNVNSDACQCKITFVKVSPAQKHRFGLMSVVNDIYLL